MKIKVKIKFVLIFFIVFSLIFFLFKTITSKNEDKTNNVNLNQSTSAINQKQKGDKLVLYYFHRKNRCPSCILIESLTDETIDKFFKEQINKNKLEWKKVNVDLPENEHFKKHYKLYANALIISEVKDGEELKWENLDKIYDLMNDKEAFQEYVQTELNKFSGSN